MAPFTTHTTDPREGAYAGSGASQVGRVTQGAGSVGAAKAILDSVRALDDASLYEKLQRAGAQLTSWRVEVLLALGEVHERKLYLQRGFATLTAFAQEILHLSEGNAGAYASVARSLHNHPEVAAALLDGDLTPTSARRLLPAMDKLLPHAARALLDACRNQSTREVERLVAQAVLQSKHTQRRPAQPHVVGGVSCAASLLPVEPRREEGKATCLAAGPSVPAPRTGGDATTNAPSQPTAHTAMAGDALGADSAPAQAEFAPEGAAPVPGAVAAHAEVSEEPRPRASMSIRPRGDGLATITLRNVPVELCDLIEELVALERHAVRNGDVGTVLCRALRMRRDAIIRRRFGAPKKRNPAAPSDTPLLPAAKTDATLPVAKTDAAPAPSDRQPRPSAQAEARKHARVAEDQPVTQTLTRVKIAVTDRSLREKMAGVKSGALPGSEQGKSMRGTKGGTGNGRASRRRKAIPAAVRREVYERDGGRCAYVDPETGRRCGSQDGLQFEHRVPVALGGPDTVENIMLLCRHHNRLRAEQVFGRERIAAIVARKQQRAVTSPAIPAPG